MTLVEAQEPLVSASVLTGDAAIPREGKPSSRNRVRALTPEEEEIQRMAEEKVKQALEMQVSLVEV